MGKQELLDRARDELFSHIHRCGVLKATETDQDSWMTETIEYLAERYPDLDVSDLTELKTVGLRFCQPVISRLKKDEPAAETEADTSETSPSTDAAADEAPDAESAVAEGEVSETTATDGAEADNLAEGSEAAVGAA